MCSNKFHNQRGCIQGDIFSPSLFTLALDSIFRRHDVHSEGVGGSPLNCPQVSKLEYADDAALLNQDTTDASARITTLANGGTEEASLNISIKKTKVMPIQRYEPVSETIEEEVMALKLKHKCPICERTFPTQRGMRIHQNHPKIPCEKGRPPASRKGSLADKLVNKAKKVKQAQAMPHVTLNEHQLENVLNFDYLGCRTSGDGDDKADMQQRMNIATAKCASLNKIWKDHRLPRSYTGLRHGQWHQVSSAQ